MVKNKPYRRVWPGISFTLLACLFFAHLQPTMFALVVYLRDFLYQGIDRIDSNAVLFSLSSSFFLSHSFCLSFCVSFSYLCLCLFRRVTTYRSALTLCSKSSWSSIARSMNTPQTFLSVCLSLSSLPLHHSCSSTSMILLKICLCIHTSMVCHRPPHGS